MSTVTRRTGAYCGLGGAVVALMLMAVSQCSRTAPGLVTAPIARHGLSFTTYHFDRARTGWTDSESILVPTTVGRGLTRSWASAPFDDASVAYQDDAGSHERTFPPRVFATPLYLDDVTLSGGAYAGTVASVVIIATTNDMVYALAAADVARGGEGGTVQAGTVLWHAQVGTPVYVDALDHGMVLGVLGTPVIDTSTSPPTLYVAAADAGARCSKGACWQVFALDVTNGSVLPGWPLAIDPSVVPALDGNVTPGSAPPEMAAVTIESQRTALLLSADGTTLFLGFASYYDGHIGWMVAVDARSRKVTAAFSGSPFVPEAGTDPGESGNIASAGMWGAGGPALADDGRVFITTGNSPHHALGQRGVWGNSLLSWTGDLALSATYTPFNYCMMDLGDTDLGGSSPVVFDVDPSRTATPHLAAFGGKQGVVYLVDRDHLGGGTTGRPAGCNDDGGHNDPASDTSLYGPAVLDAYAPPSVGPLPVFGPYSDGDESNALNNAKMRTTPALFRPASGEIYLYVAGNSRAYDARADAAPPPVVPPCVARVEVALSAGQRAYLRPDFVTNTTAILRNPGSPIVTSHDGGQDPVVWVLDQNNQRTDPVVPEANLPAPNGALLYAFDGQTLQQLWRTAPGDLGVSGKYGHVVVAHGSVYVATDRLAAFGP